MTVFLWSLSVLIALAAAFLARVWWCAEAEERERRKRARERFHQRPKAPILKVGTVSRAPSGRLLLEGWAFDYRVPLPIYYAIHDGTRAYTVMLGYTEEELLYIAEHPAEFEEVER